MGHACTNITTTTITAKPKKPPLSSSLSSLATTLFFIVLFTIPTLFILHHPPSTACLCTIPHSPHRPSDSWSGDLRDAAFAWNRLSFDKTTGPLPPISLKIAVFSRKWPAGATPGGMERHALALHSALASRGHRIHVFTSPPLPKSDPINHSIAAGGAAFPRIHYHRGEGGHWNHHKGWELFLKENEREPFDVVHSESVALPHWLAHHLPNLAVSWHGIGLERLHADIFEDLLLRPQGDPMSPGFNRTIQGAVPKLLSEIRFFKSYAHHVALSDSSGEMLRDVYQIPSRRVHVILNGVEEGALAADPKLGREFRSRIGVPENASLVLGVAGRLVRDKGHPLLHQAFPKLVSKHPDVYLVVAGSGPWERRYRELGPRVRALGSMGPSELRLFYNSIDIFVDPTLRPQGLDRTLMEAMMAGKPVMASRFPSIRGSIVVDDEFGFMFAPNFESLLETLEMVAAEGSERLAARGKACRNYAATMFPASKMAMAYERLFLCIKSDKFCVYP